MRPVIRRVAILSLASLALVGCDMVERADRTESTTSLERRNFEIDVQPIMRGTVASEAIVVGDTPTVV